MTVAVFVRQSSDSRWTSLLSSSPLLERTVFLVRIISTFFILKSRQGKKYGRYAMDLVEKRAKEVHGCKALSLNTMPARVILDPEHWRRQGAEYDPSSQPVNE